MHNHFNCPYFTPGSCRPIQQPPYSGFYWPDCPFPGNPCACQKSSESDAANPDSAHQQNGSCLITNDLNVGADLTVGGATHLKGDLIVDGKIISPQDDVNPSGGDDTTTPDDGPGGIAPEQSTIDVSGDGITVSATTVDGARLIRLADVKKIDSNSMGTTHVTSASMPAGSGAEVSMRYKLYKDVTAGNTDAETITLAPGSKLEHAGGVPGKTDNGQGTQLSVEGGELSWVHSSDIGMIQDGQLPTGMTRAQVGAHNADVLRMVASSRWNLILDGMYYVDLGIKTGATRDILLNNAVVLRRPLRIKGGGLTAARYLFCVEAGGGIVMEDVVLDNLENYPMIYVDPWGGLVECVEMYRCSMKTSAAPTGGRDHAYVARFIGGTGKDVGHVDTVNERMPDGIPRGFNKTNMIKFYGLADNTGIDSRYGFTAATRTDPHMLYVYPAGQPCPSGPSKTAAFCYYEWGAQLYVPHTDGEMVFRQNAGGSAKHMGMVGDFIPATEKDEGDVLYEENGSTVYFTAVLTRDDLQDGVLVRGCNPPVEHNGVRRFIMDDCTVMSHQVAVEMGSMEVTEVFRIRGNLFYEVCTLALNIGTNNDSNTSDDWAARSCPLVVTGNTFRGIGKVQEAFSTPYAGALLYEGDTVFFNDNLIENIITTTNTYDCYLSCNKLEYRRNVVRNVLLFQMSTKLFGYMKAKGVRVGWNYDAEYGADKTSHPRKLSRLYEGNRYEANLKDVRELCKEHMEKNRDTLMPAYKGVAWDGVPQEAKDEVLREKVLRTMFDNVVSPWAFDTFTVRDNVVDMPDCVLMGTAVSGGYALVRRWVFSGNELKLRCYENTPKRGRQSTAVNGYELYLFSIEATSEGTEVEIVGNRFESKGREIMNLLCLAGALTLRSLRVEDNEFVDCGYRISQRLRAQVAGATPSHDGVIQAERLCLRNNREAAGLDEGFTGKYSVQRMFGTWYLPVQFRGHGGTDDVVEFWDSQRRGVSAPTAKMLLLPVGAGGMTVRSTHWCRPMDVENAWLPQTGGPYEYSDKSLSLLYTFATMGREGGVGGIVPKGYCVAVRYCVKGQWKERKLEMRCSENPAGRAAGSTATELGVSARGTDGRRICHKADVAAERAAYTRYGTVSARNTRVDWLDDLGLGFLLLCRAVMDTDLTLINYNTPMLRLALYTGADGTKNDPGTEITVTVTDIDPAADLAGEDGTKVLGATSPFESFVPKGSTLTSDERTALLTGDTIAFKVEPSDAGVVHSATLTPGDAGWWCVDPDSGHVVVWTGTAWSE